MIVKMRLGFLEDTLDTRSSNGRDDLLLSELRFVDSDGTLYKVPKGASTDGGSTPRLCWVIPGFEPTGKHWFDWILHDGGYRDTLQVFANEKWVSAGLSRLQCDHLLDRALQMHGMGVIKRSIVYRVLRAEGWKFFKN